MSAPAYDHIEVSREDAVLTVVLDRPHRLNAATPQMLDELIDVFSATSDDDAIGAVIVTGRGRAFCSGADLIEDRPDLSTMARDDYRDGGGRVTLTVFEAKQPVIAAINGPAVGFGVTLTLPMDIRLASRNARFSLPFVRRGIVPEACSSWFLPRLVGMGQALDWISTGRTFNAEEAMSAGLVHGLYEPDELLSVARGLAREITEHASPVSVAMSRRMLWRMQAAGHPRDAHGLESRMLYDRTRSADSQEGMNAFLEKRAAVFPGRVSSDLPNELR